MIRPVLSLMIFSLLLVSCRKPVPTHVVTQVDGVVKDANTGKALNGVPVVIEGCRDYFYGGPRCHELADSAITDINGHFSIRFGSDGQSTYFKVRAKENERFANSSEAQLRTRKYNQVDLTVYPTKLLRVRLLVRQNPFDTLRIKIGRGFFNTIYGRTVDTVLRYYYLADPVIDINLLVTDHRIARQRALRESVAPTPPIPDTLHHSITIDNTANLPVVQ